MSMFPKVNISKDKINTITLVKLELTNIMGITES
ncbi:hypothetical protein BOH78_4448 [Pichia kudriavzevii]|uniref:Uncharacterized protein n=1 Tax=Pichia kudriavzevii TaxID=4909 RepID=A0A099NPE9_PICKU|nr:hypothetical protein JL09_g6168 [Pichia kudriavzevii]ONH71513.1 hypothetical protein BOH78_4448 [Pichia kudriavzevii]